MKKRAGLIIKFIVFICLVVSLVHLIDNRTVMKYMYDQREPHTETYKGFYNMKKNTVDTLIVGTSQAAAAFNPQDMYDKAGIRAYNLSSSAQPVYNSYFWIKEALKYQHPSAVVFDVNYLFIDFNDEGASRRALDNMRNGNVKYEAAKANVELNPNTKQSVISYFLPYIRYHSRWGYLNENDFESDYVEKPSYLKGFWEYHGIAPDNNDIVPYKGDKVEPAEMVKTSYEYLEKMRKLCDENGIKLVLVKVPSPTFTEEDHQATEDYAEKYDLPFYDFNTESLYKKSGFDFSTDMDDVGKFNGHVNPYGARKISNYVAEQLVKNNLVKPHEDEQWSSTKKYNDGDFKDFELAHETDIKSYLKMLKDNRYTIFITVKDEASYAMDNDIRDSLADLGLKSDWNEDAFHKSYAAVIDQGKVTYENMSSEWINYKSAFRDGKVRAELYSAGADVGNDCSVMIDGTEYAKKVRGLNIVVYSNDRKCVIDSVTFDTYDPAYGVTR